MVVMDDIASCASSLSWGSVKGMTVLLVGLHRVMDEMGWDEMGWVHTEICASHVFFVRHVDGDRGAGGLEKKEKAKRG